MYITRTDTLDWLGGIDKSLELLSFWHTLIKRGKWTFLYLLSEESHNSHINRDVKEHLRRTTQGLFRTWHSVWQRSKVPCQHLPVYHAQQESIFQTPKYWEYVYVPFSSLIQECTYQHNKEAGFPKNNSLLKMGKGRVNRATDGSFHERV